MLNADGSTAEPTILERIMSIFNAPYAAGFQAGQKVADVVVPQPQWILTPYTEKRLNEINPAKYQELVKEYNSLKTQTQQSYANTFNPITAIQGAITNPYVIGIVIVIIAFVVLAKRR